MANLVNKKIARQRTESDPKGQTRGIEPVGELEGQQFLAVVEGIRARRMPEPRRIPEDER